MYYIGGPKPRGPSTFALRHQARQCTSSKGGPLIRGSPNRRQDLGAANVWSKNSWTPSSSRPWPKNFLDPSRTLEGPRNSWTPSSSRPVSKNSPRIHGPRIHMKPHIYMVS